MAVNLRVFIADIAPFPNAGAVPALGQIPLPDSQRENLEKLRQSFREHVEQWKNDTPRWSSVSEMIAHPNTRDHSSPSYSMTEKPISGTTKKAERENKSAPAPESPEMAWLVSNAQELGRYKGEWLLIQGTQLLAHSRNFSLVRAAVEERELSSPFVYYVPTDEESNTVTI